VKAPRTKPFKSAEFVESEPDVEPTTPRPDETASEPPPSEPEPGPSQPQEECVDLTEDLALSDTSSESPDGVSEDERWMVVDEFFDPFVTVEEEEEAAAIPEAESPSQQPSAPPARPSSPVPGPSGWTPSSAPAKVS